MLVDLKKAENSAKIISKIRALLEGDLILKELDEATESVQNLLLKLPETTTTNNWKVLSSGLNLMRSRLALIKIAENDDGNILSEKEKFKILKTTFRSACKTFHLESHIQAVFNKEEETDFNLSEMKSFLLNLDYPSLYFTEKNNHKNSTRFPKNKINKNNNSGLPLIKLIAFIDKTPHVSPQIVQPRINHDLEIEIEGINWPKNAKSLEFDFLTTYQKDEYSISALKLPKPTLDKENKFKAKLHGNIIFRSEQGILSDKVIFKTRGAFQLENGEEKEVKIIGHSELKFRVLSKKSMKIDSGYSVLDSHIYNLITELIEKNTSINDYIDDLLEVLISLNNLLGTYTQGAVFKESEIISEPEFQNKLRDDLRGLLGKKVEEHKKQGGGFTDLVYKGIVIELKVEKENGNRQYLLKKYTGQPVQYQGSEGKQVSIVVVLDLTEKTKPVGDIRNNILITDVETHGGHDEEKRFPSKAFLFVIDGNTKNPSDYSR
ncbi:hypothetical protein [Gracilimonas amylolytica]|uniref:hypothetical protein n=1 Tax=Gracilimonas amylolytica TaxID=1749045 RepID=UPI000CD8655C|nr:hypothetical protein [Gracilimonas amylolytica]